MSTRKIAVLFPGQGSQYLGMAAGFLETDAAARQLMAEAEEITGFPVRTLCQEGPMEELTRAVHLQPALTAVNLVCWGALERAGVKADYFAGHSLGEFSALCAAGVLSVADTMGLVTERGRLMEREGVKNPGGMRAVLGLTMAEIEAGLAAVAGKGTVVAANHNSEKQVVISGDAAGLEAASALFDEQGARVIALNVAVANHSPLVAAAVPDFEKAMAGVSFKPPQVPVLFNVSAAAESDPARIRAMMAGQLAKPVRWHEIVTSLAADGVRVFIEAGPKNVLSGLLKKILPKGTDYKSFQVDSPETLAKCLAGLQ